MRTVTFKSVLDRALRLCGIPVADAQTDDVAMLTEFINVRLRLAWEAYTWPDAQRIEQRFYRAAYDNAATYAEDDEVYYATEDAYYRAIDATTGNLPTDTDYWEAADDDLERYVDWEQTGETAIGAVWALWSANPRLSRTAAQVGYSLSERGVEVLTDANVGSSVWVEYGVRAPEMTDAVYDTTEAYAVGDRVYFATDGKCYECISTASAGDTPATDVDKWTEVEFPYILAAYCALGAYRDMLKPDGQTARARLEEGDVEGLLLAEIDKIEAVQGQRRRYGCATRTRV